MPEKNSISVNSSTNLSRNLYLDNKGLFRCSGMFENIGLEEGARRPILLLLKDYFTRLDIENVHKECLHSGVSQNLARVRYRFWIPKGRSTVKSVVRLSLICKRHEGGPYIMAQMAPLPASRIQESPVFSNRG